MMMAHLNNKGWYMGVVRVISCSRNDSEYDEFARFGSKSSLPNPNPHNFKLVKGFFLGDYTLILVNYPDCTNYEGNKVLLFKGVDITTLKNLKVLDPHFSQNTNHISPIARFEPTQFGWDLGVSLMIKLNNSDGEWFMLYLLDYIKTGRKMPKPINNVDKVFSIFQTILVISLLGLMFIPNTFLFIGCITLIILISIGYVIAGYKNLKERKYER